ncbi:MAG: hypothetical protein ACOYB3_00770 [Azonexus sp.]
MTPEELRIVYEKLATHMANESKRADVSWGHIAEAIEASSDHLSTGWAGAVTKLTGSQPVIASIAKSLSSAFRGSDEHILKMEKAAEDLRLKLGTLYNPTAARQSAEFNTTLRQHKAALKEAEAHRNMWKVVAETMTGTTGAALTALLGSLKLALDYSHQINAAFIQGNSSVEARSKLIKDISKVQAETGNEMQDMAKAAAALTNYGFDLRSNFKDTLTTIVKMEEGLGVSYESSAQMAVTVNRIGGDFKKIADGVARVKTDTALAAEEAVKFATQISKAVMMLKPGSGSLVDQTAEYINRLAGALKELTGNGQDIVTMLSSFTTEAGMMGAATLGATPDFLASPAQTKKVTENFVKYVNQQLSGTSGFQRMATIQLLAEQFNTTADLIVNADKMLAKYNETQKNATSLQEQWRQQTSEIGKTFSKIYESMRSIVQQALLPTLQKLRPALATLADTVGWLAKQTWVVYAAGVALVGSAILATAAFARLSIAITQAALASSFMQKTMGVGGVTNMFSRGGARDIAKWLRMDLLTGRSVSAARATGVTRIVSNAVIQWLPRIGGWISSIGSILTRLAGPLAAVAAAGMAGYAIGLAADKYIIKGLLKTDISEGLLAAMDRKNVYRLQQSSYGAGGKTRDDILKDVSAMAASGKTAEEIQKYIIKNASSVKGIHGETLTKERREKILLGLVEDAGREITRQRVRMGYTTLTEQSTEDKARDAQMIELFKSIALNTELNNKILERTEDKHGLIESTKRRDREEYEGEERLKRQAADRMAEAMKAASGARWR